MLSTLADKIWDIIRISDILYIICSLEKFYFEIKSGRKKFGSILYFRIWLEAKPAQVRLIRKNYKMGFGAKNLLI